ncbi:hypothetical protein VNO80_26926 [Phaseolus coccineus]|uniref:Uncharacterized protein n=1 Tax=Phaseolus coccineus TaxID=3886 RepID=A0AAN9QEW9_PHACN
MSSKEVALILLVATMFMTSHGRRVTVLKHDVLGGTTQKEILGKAFGQFQHVMQRGNGNNANNDEKSNQHCYAQCIAGCVNPSDSKAENLCAKMCQDKCQL